MSTLSYGELRVGPREQILHYQNAPGVCTRSYSDNLDVEYGHRMSAGGRHLLYYARGVPPLEPGR